MLGKLIILIKFNFQIRKMKKIISIGNFIFNSV